MPILDRRSPLALGLLDDYTKQLLRVVSEVFAMSPERLANYLNSLGSLSPAERILAMHESPLNVVSAVTGVPITDEMRQRYRDIEVEPKAKDLRAEYVFVLPDFRPFRSSNPIQVRIPSDVDHRQGSVRVLDEKDDRTGRMYRVLNISAEVESAPLERFLRTHGFEPTDVTAGYEIWVPLEKHPEVENVVWTGFAILRSWEGSTATELIQVATEHLRQYSVSSEYKRTLE